MRAMLSGLLVAVCVAGCSGRQETTRGTVMVFGDSNAHGLAQANPDVINAAVQGERVSREIQALDLDVSGEERVEQLLFNGTAPDVVVVLTGTNDIYWALHRGLDSDAWMRSVERGLRVVVSRLRASGVKRVILSTLPPQRPGGARGRDRYIGPLQEMNVRIVILAHEEGIEVIDTFAIVNSDINAYLSPDDVHLTPQGHRAVWDGLLAMRIFDR